MGQKSRARCELIAMYPRPFLPLAAPAFTRNGLAGRTRLLGAVSGVEIFAGEIVADIRSESIYHNSIRQLQRCETCWTCCWLCLKMSSYQMESCIRGLTSTRRYGRLSLEKGLVAPAKKATEKIRSLLQ